MTQIEIRLVMRMAGLMVKMGKFDKAIEIYTTLIERIFASNQKEVIALLLILLNNNAVAHAQYWEIIQLL
jgi:predicted negative regulator of RcsB-dependent stress response